MLVRLKAFAFHLAISIVMALLTLMLVFQVWYPTPLHKAVGVTHIFLLLLLVDVLLGPLMTLVVYKKGKKSLPFDLAVIALLQFSALSYGLWTVAEGRPAWLVFNADRFDLVRVLDIDRRRSDTASPEYRNPPLLGPLWVASSPPSDADAHDQLLFESVMGGSDMPQRPDLYHPLSEQAEVVKARLHPIKELEKFNSPDQVRIVLQEFAEADAWLPLMANASPMVVLLSRQSGGVIGIADLRPWQE